MEGAELVVLAVVFAVSAALVALVRLAAPKLGLIDVPNARSSHVRPTPRGGGIGIVVAILAWFAWAWGAGKLDPTFAVGVGGGGFVVATVGLLDDRIGLRNSVRIVLWLVAAAWASAWTGGLTVLDIGFASWPLGWIGAVISTLGLVWFLNICNFMDGIDGMAGSATIIAGVVGCLLLVDADLGELAGVMAALAAASAGFLIWNLPPARVFLGDVGSGFVGFLFGAVVVASSSSGRLPLPLWGIVFVVYLADANFTMLRKAARREAWWLAHRTYGYQLLAIAWGSHGRVTSLYVVGEVAFGALAIAAQARPAYALDAFLFALLVAGMCRVWIDRRYHPPRHSQQYLG